MKTKKIWMMIMAFLIGTIGGSVNAQSHLKAVMKKCESIDNVDVNVVNNKDRKTGKLSRRVTNIQFSSKENPKLLDEFLSAFNQDKDNADKVIENKQKGKMVPTYCLFIDGTTKISFNMSIYEQVVATNWEKTPKDVSINCIEKFNVDPNSRDFGDFDLSNIGKSFHFDFDNLDFSIPDSAFNIFSDSTYKEQMKQLKNQLRQYHFNMKNASKNVSRLEQRNASLLARQIQLTQRNLSNQMRLKNRATIVKSNNKVNKRVIIIS
jgi:hypothetical protein